MQVPRQWLFPRPGDRQGRFAVRRLLHGAHSARCVLIDEQQDGVLWGDRLEKG
jgi:hypothetical protein